MMYFDHFSYPKVVYIVTCPIVSVVSPTKPMCCFVNCSIWLSDMPNYLNANQYKTLFELPLSCKTLLTKKLETSMFTTMGSL